MAGPFVKIDGIVMMGGGDLFVLDGARAAGKERVWRALELAWDHMDDPDLREAWHGGAGPLGGVFEMTFEEFLEHKRS